MTSLVRSTTNPLASVITIAANSTSDFFAGIFNASDLSRQNRGLKQYETIARQYSETVDRLAHEIDNLRALNELPPIVGREKVAATVIGYFANENRITISVGSNRGVRPGLAVVTGEGLVGTIQTVGPFDSQVSLLADPNRKIGALVITRNPPSAGLIKGENASLLVLTLDSTSPVENGDLVATSGYSDRIPRGIPIGRVNQVYNDLTTGSKRVDVFPNVTLGSLREVIVL
ncbi:MAG: rod shape-determining protein MreC, partial [Chlorobia bacterium]|nr:rod shape-determining protein MreC [Fimbriimonadaceae bacterium]